MSMAKKISVYFEESDSREYQGNEQKIEKYRKRGYRVTFSNNGFWVLTKKARVTVDVVCDDGSKHTFNMRSGILDHYNRQRLTRKLTDKFKSDFDKGLIQISIENGSYTIV